MRFCFHLFLLATLQLLDRRPKRSFVGGFDRSLAIGVFAGVFSYVHGRFRCFRGLLLFLLGHGGLLLHAERCRLGCCCNISIRSRYLGSCCFGIGSFACRRL